MDEVVPPIWQVCITYATPELGGICKPTTLLKNLSARVGRQQLNKAIPPLISRRGVVS
jgi:hypothetical protein